ncbi:MTOR-associated protein MEAK7-like [Adelges cooleyi]|uniref:MTOR-associated protein MEAK7-like n=1 Tax=Adelges cooleyi TaxID=133065 RepID=UPI00217FA39D|nr:MTOR-associated protein MEAK7-like [Adelges cooleyi]
MGAKKSKNPRLPPLRPEESVAIDNLMNFNDHVHVDNLLSKWQPLLTENMAQHVRLWFLSNQSDRSEIEHIYQSFALNAMYQENYHGLVKKIFSNSSVLQYSIDLTESLMICLKSTDQYKHWVQVNAKSRAIPQLGLEFSNESISSSIDTWLQKETYYGLMHRILITTLYGVPENNNLFPAIGIDEKYNKSFKTILDFGWIMFIVKHLPSDCQNSWRLLYSSSSHGESFQALIAAIIDQGCTIVVVKDTDGNIFGGYASQSWIMKPSFYGDSGCFLFTLLPNFNCCVASGRNDNFMYMNNGQYTFPNGLGMGGQMGYWGLWLDSEYGKGQCNVSCSTFADFSMPTKEKDFVISSLEVWCVKEKINDESDEKKRKKPTNTDYMDMKLLEMAGRPKYTDNLKSDENHPY